MSAVNPYTPPRAEVSDVQAAATGYSVPRVWAASGRLGRLRYLAYLTVATLLMYVALGVAGGIGAVTESPLVVGLLMTLVYIPYIVLSVLLLIQRSHDMNWTGWTVLLAFIPLVGLIWIFKAGSPGANRWGNPPPANTTAVKIFGLIGPVIGIIAIIGIMAAVSLPAYQKYTERAKAAQQRAQQAPMPPAQQ